MAFADQLAATPPQIRYLALVGQFMAQWAALEATINNAIEQAFSITAKQGAVLLPDIPFSKKIFILRTAAHESLEDPERKHYNGVLIKISQFSEVRNVVAHHSFHPDDDELADGVMFVVVKARGKLEFPPTRWSITAVQEHVATMRAFDKEIETLTPKLKAFSVWRNSALIAAAMFEREQRDAALISTNSKE